MTIAAFDFIDTESLPLAHEELELVEPAEQYVDELLAATRHPLTRDLMPAQARTTRDGLLQFLKHNPRGRTMPDAARDIAPGYTFWMRIRPGARRFLPHRPPPQVTMAGSISLRIGHSVNLDFYLGHVGYHVLPPARGHRYSERAARLIVPIAKAHGHVMLWITCNPDNLASQKTCERLGAVFVDTVPVPKGNALYTQGDRFKCRFRLDI